MSRTLADENAALSSGLNCLRTRRRAAVLHAAAV